MTTSALIRAIAQDAAVRRWPLSSRIAIAIIVGGAVASLLFALGLGTRPDLGAGLNSWRFLLKVAVALTLFLAALWTCVALARPETRVRDAVLRVAVAPLMLMLGAGYELMTVPSADWYARTIGTNSRVCLVAIPLLSIALLVAMLAALRAGAPSSPSAAGAAAGLVAAGLAATLYATHCPDDSPLFVVVWYFLAIALVTLIGAGAGRLALRW